MAIPGAVNLFLVSDLGDGSLGSAPVPGPFRPGTPQSGATVGVETSAGELGTVIAHELGHYLGLWHTRDSLDEVVSDQLPDTTDEGPNLMNTENWHGRRLTEQQGHVLRSSPFVR